MPSSGERAAADVGGTFTDILLRRSTGELTYHKLLSTPPAYDQAVVSGIGELLGQSGTRKLAEVVHGTTVATNAVLERRGARTALLTTKGFRDVLELRRVRMPHLYDLFWTKPPPLVERSLRLEVDERMSARGEVLRQLREGGRGSHGLPRCLAAQSIRRTDREARVGAGERRARLVLGFR